MPDTVIVMDSAPEHNCQNCKDGLNGRKHWREKECYRRTQMTKKVTWYSDGKGKTLGCSCWRE